MIPNMPIDDGGMCGFGHHPTSDTFALIFHDFNAFLNACTICCKYL